MATHAQAVYDTNVDDLEAVAQYHAITFHKSTGVEYDELLQEARCAAWLAASGGVYDPHKAALKTYASHYVFNKLFTLVGKHQRKHPNTVEIDEYVVADEPTPEDVVYFHELLRQLPEDARTVVSMVLEDAGSVANLAPTKARQIIANGLNWPKDRLREAFAAITQILSIPG